VRGGRPRSGSTVEEDVPAAPEGELAGFPMLSPMLDTVPNAGVEST